MEASALWSTHFVVMRHFLRTQKQNDPRSIIIIEYLNLSEELPDYPILYPYSIYLIPFFCHNYGGWFCFRLFDISLYIFVLAFESICILLCFGICIPFNTFSYIGFILFTVITVFSGSHISSFSIHISS